MEKTTTYEGQETQDEATEKEKTIAGERIDSVCTIVFDVVIVAHGVDEYICEVERAKSRIFKKIGDAYISVKAYEWNFERHRIYATVEIEKSQFSSIRVGDIETEFFSVHAVDEIAYTTPVAQKRKLK